MVLIHFIQRHIGIDPGRRVREEQRFEGNRAVHDGQHVARFVGGEVIPAQLHAGSEHAAHV
jgi:hypothetical protein